VPFRVPGPAKLERQAVLLSKSVGIPVEYPAVLPLLLRHAAFIRLLPTNGMENGALRLIRRGFQAASQLIDAPARAITESLRQNAARWQEACNTLKKVKPVRKARRAEQIATSYAEGIATTL